MTAPKTRQFLTEFSPGRELSTNQMPPTKKVRRNTAKKPTFSVIGPGRLGTALALALTSAGYQIAALAGRNRQKLRSAVKLLDDSGVFLVTKEVAEAAGAELIVVAVPDDQISEVAATLEKVVTRRRPTVLHTSGALSSSVLGGLSRKGWHTGSMHPLASISDSVTGVEALRKAYWCIEGDATATRLARRIVADLGA